MTEYMDLKIESRSGKVVIESLRVSTSVTAPASCFDKLHAEETLLATCVLLQEVSVCLLSMCRLFIVSIPRSWHSPEAGDHSCQLVCIQHTMNHAATAASSAFAFTHWRYLSLNSEQMLWYSKWQCA